MRMATVARSKGQVYSVGNYLMTGKVLGKGHFARVEEATHRIIGKKVAIKVIDLTCIKEEYARRNLHREPRVMARLRHPCIAALYETMMHGPRLYVVMEAAGGGDLCALVAGVRGGARGLPESRARSLAAQLASAVRHMHARGVVHRDLKMENIMLDSTKQYIKIVDFGLSNVWTAGGALRTQCGSLEYAAPELFVDGRRYGPEVDLWSIGVIVYGMVTGGLPFGAEGAAGAGSQSRPQLRAAIARGFGRKHHAALAFVSAECKGFIQHLLEPRVELRMRIEEAVRHRWLKRPGMRMRTHPFADVDPKINKEIYRQIAELCGQTVMDVVAQIKADPFGATAGMYNIKTHLLHLHAPGRDLLWSCNSREPRSASPPEYRTRHDPGPDVLRRPRLVTPERSDFKTLEKPNGVMKAVERIDQRREKEEAESARSQIARSKPVPSSKLLTSGLRKPVFRVYESGDCGAASARLPSIREHSTEAGEAKRRPARPPPPAGDGLPGWRSGGAPTPPARVLLQSHATTIKRASLGLTRGSLRPIDMNHPCPLLGTGLPHRHSNISSPHSSSNSHCKSERSAPVGWYSARGDATPLYRLRRTAPMK